MSDVIKNYLRYVTFEKKAVGVLPLCASCLTLPYTKELLGLIECLDCLGLANHVEIEAAIKGNTPDLVITSENELLPMDFTTDTSVTSDHTAIIFGIPAPKINENKITKCGR